MKRNTSFRAASLLLVLLLLLTVLGGCQSDERSHRSESRKDDTTSTEDKQTEGTAVQDGETNTEKEEPKPALDLLTEIRTHLNQDFSLDLSFMYMNLAVDGFMQDVQQQYAKDGSFHFAVTNRQWDHVQGVDHHGGAEFYYQYEGDDFVCYMREDGGQLQRHVVDAPTLYAMKTDKASIMGPNALFPRYLEQFTETKRGEVYTFRLPMEEVLEDETYLNMYVRTILAMRNVEYDVVSGLDILCTCTVEKGTYRPKTVSYDFSALKPHVLSNGAQSGEAAFGEDFLTMEYVFDFNLPQTVPIPEEFLK